MNIRNQILLFLLLSLVVGVGVAVKMRGNEKPDVEVAGGEVFDAGKIPAGHPLIHRFHLTNSHSFPVGLAIVTTGCECTTATASAAAIPAHGAADITLHVNLEDSKDISSGVCFATAHDGQKVETWLLLTARVAPSANALQKTEAHSSAK